MFVQGGKSRSRYPGILWIPPYPSDSLDPRCILRIRKSLPDFHIRNTMRIRTIYQESRESRRYHENPEDNVEIQRIQEIRWRSRESKGYDRDPRDTISSVSVTYRMYRESIGCIAIVSSGLCGLLPYPG